MRHMIDDWSMLGLAYNIRDKFCNPTRISMPGDRAGTQGESYDRKAREQETREDRAARLDRQRLRTNHWTPGKCWVPLLVTNKKYIYYTLSFLHIKNNCIWTIDILKKPQGRVLFWYNNINENHTPGRVKKIVEESKEFLLDKRQFPDWNL